MAEFVGGSNEMFDAMVVGSGASGGWACRRFAGAGMKVALVDAGHPQSDKNFTEHLPAFKMKFRDQAPEVIRACMEYNHDWFCNDLEEPYSTAREHAF